MRYSLFGGIITGATIGLPVIDFLNCFCCAGVILGGFLSVFFAVKDLDPTLPPISRSDALRMGVVSGLFGAIIGTAFHAIVLLLAGDFFLEMVSSMIRDGDLERSLPPGTLDDLREMFDASEGFSVVGVVIHLFIWLVLGPLFGLVGGLLGYSFLQRRPAVQPFPPQE
jgi:hypothetical protein